MDYEIIVKKIETKTVPDKQYVAIEGKKDDDGSQKYEYVWKDTEKEICTEVLKFRLREDQLDVRHLAAFLSGRT